MYLSIPEDRVIVGTNEIIAQQVLNRTFKKLIQNDLRNLEYYKRQLSGFQIHEFGDLEGGYSIGDVVWVPQSDDGVGPYLVRSIKKNNENDPRMALSDSYVDGHPNFGRYGWKDLNYSPSLDDSGTNSALSDCVGDAFTVHETDDGMHRYGILSKDPESIDYVYGKLAKKDFGNVDPGRGNIFFPFQSGHFTTDSVINGIYRIWDNGFLEMDIVFRLGKDGVSVSDPNVYANTLSVQPSPTANS